MNIDELERKAARARAAGESVLLDPDEVDDAVYWLRRLNERVDYWAHEYTNRRAYRAWAWVRRTFRTPCG